MADALHTRAAEVLAANQADIRAARESGMAEAMVDRVLNGR